MGTAVLLPHDCLRNSKARHKGQLSEAIFHSGRVFRVQKGTLQASVSSDPSTVCLDLPRKNTLTGRVEWTPKSPPASLHNHGSDLLQLKKEFGWRKFKASKSTEMKEMKFASNLDCDVPVFTILQRPKTNKAADELIAKFLTKKGEEKLVDGQLNEKQESNVMPNLTNLTVDRLKFKSDGQLNEKQESNVMPNLTNLTVDRFKFKSTSHLKSSEIKLSRCNLKKGACITTTEEPKILDFSSRGTKLADKVKSYISETDPNAGKGLCRSVAAGTAQPINILRRESQRGFDDVLHLKGLCQVASLEATSENKNVKKARPIESNGSKHLNQTQPTILASTVPDGLLRLKRSATDPQVVKQLTGHYRSELVDIPCNEAKSYFGFARTASMSCPERWAGPSYYSSPAPSSLPLPKFSCRSQRRALFQSSGEGDTRNILESPDSEFSSSESSTPQGGTLDMAFATKCLRRMLKLDPF
ncbi:hypothetical protein L7F22_016721 [Adiantum nelumboides]|nr:hypothetical protein [Adiantum nelumboides]